MGHLHELEEEKYTQVCGIIVVASYFSSLWIAIARKHRRSLAVIELQGGHFYFSSL